MPTVDHTAYVRLGRMSGEGAFTICIDSVEGDASARLLHTDDGAQLYSRKAMAAAYGEATVRRIEYDVAGEWMHDCWDAFMDDWMGARADERHDMRGAA